jgi:malate dehydrogenase
VAKISIIGGAGTLGAACAMSLSAHSKIHEICLIDLNEALLDNHVMDLENAFPSKVIYRGTYKDLEQSNIIIITAGVPNKNEVKTRNAYLTDNIRIFQHIGAHISTHAPNALIVTVSNPVDLLNYYLHKNFGFKKEQLIGYTLNDSYRFEWAVRKTLNLQDNLTSIYSPVIGEHGETQVPLFSHVTKNEENLEISVDEKKVIMQELKTWFVRFNELNIPRTTGWTTAIGMYKLLNALLEDSISIITGSALLNGEYGFHDVSIGVPLTINKNGINKIIEWEIEDHEKQAFDQSVKKIKGIIEENNSLFLQKI